MGEMLGGGKVVKLILGIVAFFVIPRVEILFQEALSRFFSALVHVLQHLVKELI